MHSFIYPSSEAIKKLTKELKLGDNYSQDWEYEVTDPDRLDEFIRHYHCGQLSDVEKFTLMLLILASYDDWLCVRHHGVDYWEDIKKILIQDEALHRNTVKYWSCEGNNIEDCFSITPLIRSLKTELK